MPACQSCPEYGRFWSCPPYEKPPVELGAFATILLLGVQINPGQAAKQNTRGASQVRQVTDRWMEEVRGHFDPKLLWLEGENPGSLALYGGKCRLCHRCARQGGLPCPNGHMRYSLESLGFDVLALAEQELGLPILWAGEQLPPYFLLVGALLCPGEKMPRGLDGLTLDQSFDFLQTLPEKCL